MLPVPDPVDKQNRQGHGPGQQAGPDGQQARKLLHQAGLVRVGKAEQEHLGEHVPQDAIAEGPQASRQQPRRRAQQEHGRVGKEIAETLPFQQIAGNRQQNSANQGRVGNPDQGHHAEDDPIEKSVPDGVILVFRAWQPGSAQIFQHQIQAGHQKRQGKLLRQIAVRHGIAQHHGRGNQQQQLRPHRTAPLRHRQIQNLLGKEQRHKQAHRLQRKSPQPSGKEQLAQILHQEEIGPLHIKKVPVGQQPLLHPLPHQPEKRRVLAHIGMEQGRGGEGADRKEKHRRGSEEEKPQEAV